MEARACAPRESLVDGAGCHAAGDGADACYGDAALAEDGGGGVGRGSGSENIVYQPDGFLTEHREVVGIDLEGLS